MKLYVVTTNAPGPGAGPLVKAKAAELEDRRYLLATVHSLADAADEAYEFVELEDEHGHGQGPDSGITWSDHPGDGDLKRLGPFVAATQVESMIQLQDAVRRGWRVAVGAGPHWRESGNYHYNARYGWCNIEGGAGSVEEAQAACWAHIQTAESNGLGPATPAGASHV